MMKKNQNVYALGLASILIISLLTTTTGVGNLMTIQTASATTALKFPSLHLINEKGQFIDMKLLGYKQTDGKLKQFLPFDWYLKETNDPTFAIKMEDIFKLRADQGKGFKVVDTTATGLNVDHGMNVVIHDGSNDDWDHFITYKETSNFPSQAYKNTYLLNQHNPCFSEESFQFKPGTLNPVQIYATVYFKDSNTWAEYTAQVNVIGADASDNPTTGCDTPQGWTATSGTFAPSIVVINKNTVKVHTESSHSNSNNDNNHHHDGSNSDNHDHHNHDQNDITHPRFLPGNKNLKEDQTEYDPTDTNSGTGPHVEDSSNNNSDNTEQQHHDSTNTNSDSSNSQSHDNHHEDSNNNKDSSDNNNNDKSGDNTN